MSVKVVKKKQEPEKPSIVNINCFIYEIQYVPMDELEKHGDTDMTKKVIRINSQDPLQVQKETLHHEIMHAILEDSHLFDVVHDKDFDMEEAFIRYYSPKAVQIYRDNPQIREFIYG